jgi:hypothetical protein
MYGTSYAFNTHTTQRRTNRFSLCDLNPQQLFQHIQHRVAACCPATAPLNATQLLNPAAAVNASLETKLPLASNTEKLATMVPLLSHVARHTQLLVMLLLLLQLQNPHRPACYCCCNGHDDNRDHTSWNQVVKLCPTEVKQCNQRPRYLYRAALAAVEPLISHVPDKAAADPSSHCSCDDTQHRRLT